MKAIRLLFYVYLAGLIIATLFTLHIFEAMSAENEIDKFKISQITTLSSFLIL